MKFDVAVSFQGRGEMSALEPLAFDFVFTLPSLFFFECTPAGVFCAVMSFL